MDITKLDEMNLEELKELLKAIMAKIAEMNGEEADREGLEEMLEQLPEDLEKLEELVDEIADRKADMKSKAAQRSAIINKIAKGQGTKVLRKAPGVDKEDKKMDIREIRASRQYEEAFLRGLQNHDMAECRALITANGSGTIPVPVALENEVKHAWEDNALLAALPRAYFGGNFSVGFEYGHTNGGAHTEGGAAGTEASISIGTVTLTGVDYIDWITISKQAWKGTTADNAGYVWSTLAHKVAALAQAALLSAIVSASATSSATAVGIPVYTASAAAVGTLVEAAAKLSGEAKNVKVICNRAAYAEFKAVQLGANYAADIFDGMEPIIVDGLDSFATADAGDTVAILADLSGAVMNLPYGDEVEITVDELTLANRGMVQVTADLYAGIGVVAPGRFVKINKA